MHPSHSISAVDQGSRGASRPTCERCPRGPLDSLVGMVESMPALGLKALSHRQHIQGLNNASWAGLPNECRVCGKDMIDGATESTPADLQMPASMRGEG